MCPEKIAFERKTLIKLAQIVSALNAYACNGLVNGFGGEANLAVLFVFRFDPISVCRDKGFDRIALASRLNKRKANIKT